MTVSSIRKRWPRFFVVPEAILEECPSLSPAGKLIFVALCRLVDNDYVCFPAHKYIGEICSMSEKTVRRALGELRAAALLTVEVRRDAKTGSRLSNLYTLEIPPDGSSRLRPQLETGQISRPPPPQIDQGPLVKKEGGLPPEMTRAPGQNYRVTRSIEPDLVNLKNNNSGVVFMYHEMTGLNDLSEKQVDAWIVEHGFGYVQDKLKLLAAGLETIEEPLKWLSAALDKDWKAAENLRQKRKDRRAQREREKMHRLRESQVEGEKHRIKPGQASDLIQRLRTPPAEPGPGQGGVK